MESYRTEEEQVEALRRWWDENGRSTIAAIVIALVGVFGYQGWQGHQQGQREQASEMYEAMLRAAQASGNELSSLGAADLAEQLKTSFPGSTYAQFAALHLASIAVEEGDLMAAESQLRWVLGKADKASDTAQIAQLRLARVLAANGEQEQALSILDAGSGAYSASYALARGDILLAMGRDDEARMAYSQALAESGGVGANMATVRQKLQSLTPAVDASEPEVMAPAATVDSTTDDIVDNTVDDTVQAPDAEQE